MNNIILESLTQRLNELKISAPHHLTDYTISSMLSGTTRYSVVNLMLFLNACNVKMYVKDIMDEEYIASDIDGVHNIIQQLMDKYKIKLSVMNEAMGVSYTPPRNGTSLSVTTLICILNYMKCELEIK